MPEDREDKHQEDLAFDSMTTDQRKLSAMRSEFENWGDAGGLKDINGRILYIEGTELMQHMSGIRGGYFEQAAEGPAALEKLSQIIEEYRVRMDAAIRAKERLQKNLEADKAA